MKKRWFLVFILLRTPLWSVSYFESSHYLKMEGEEFSHVRSLIQTGQDYKSFFILDQIIQNSRHLREKADAFILKGWLDYRYHRYKEASESWQQALNLLGKSHPWVDLWLSWIYLLEGDIIKASDVFEGVEKSIIEDLSLFLTLGNRLSIFRIPLKEADSPYLDFITYLKATDFGVFIGNLYGGLSFFDAKTSKITVLEPAIPSIEGNGILGLIEEKGGFYLAKKRGLYWLPKGGKIQEISIPFSKVKGKLSLIHWIPWVDGFVALFDREGLWFYSGINQEWKQISKNPKKDSFLLTRGENSEELFYLNNKGNLISLSWTDFINGGKVIVEEDLSLSGKWFEPIQVSNKEFWLANPKGKICQLIFEDGRWEVRVVRQEEKGARILAFWKGRSGLLSIITEKGEWQRLDSSGGVLDWITFPLPILSGLIYHLSAGSSHVWINIASEVYGVSEKLLFNRQ